MTRTCPVTDSPCLAAACAEVACGRPAPAPLSEEGWAKLALDVSSYGGHDQDCDSLRWDTFGKGKCSCGYTATMGRLLERAQAVLDRAAAGARA